MSDQNKPQDPTIGAIILWQWEGCYGYYERRVMQATILQVEQRTNGRWLEIKPHELNLPRWIHESEIRGYIWAQPEPEAAEAHVTAIFEHRNTGRVIAITHPDEIAIYERQPMLALYRKLAEITTISA